MIEKSGNKLKRGRGWPILKKENRERKTLKYFLETICR